MVVAGIGGSHQRLRLQGLELEEYEIHRRGASPGMERALPLCVPVFPTAVRQLQCAAVVRVSEQPSLLAGIARLGQPIADQTQGTSTAGVPL